MDRGAGVALGSGATLKEESLSTDWGGGALDRGGAEWQDEKLRQARSCTPYAPGCEIATSSPCAEVAELADALHSGCSSRQGVEVRVLSSADQPFFSHLHFDAEHLVRAYLSVNLCFL